jgi:hypothetical protein
MDICNETPGHKDECIILMTLFLGTQQGDGWLPGCKDGWGASSDYCDWNGISCDTDRHVTKIYLGSCGLVGFFPMPSIFTLPFLEKIQMPNSQYPYIKGRALKGPLPADLKFAKTLKQLELYGNTFDGGLSGLSELTSLEILDIHFNHFSGPLPDLTKCKSTLHYVSVANNQLSGTIPESWNQLTKLDTIGLAFNKHHGSFGVVRHMPFLKVVYARNNKFNTFGTKVNGTGPLLGNEVVVLDLDRNEFNCKELGKIPTTLPALKSAGGCTSDWPSQNPNTCCIAQPGKCDHAKLSKYPNCVNKTTHSPF